MESNKEEAEKAFKFAESISNRDVEKALRFARKSDALYPNEPAQKLIAKLEQEIATAGPSGGGSGTATPNATAGSSSTKATGVEEHTTSAKQRPGHAKPAAASSSSSSAAAAAAAEKSKKREYTPKQLEVVKRVKACKQHAYYEILSIERSCEESDVKRSYKKLALALHPDKNGAPGADEAFKMVSKAFQVLSDSNLRAAFDSNPNSDPTQRGGGGGGGGGASMFRGGGGMPQGFGGGNGMYTEINPEDLFNAFFGGGMGGGFGQQANVFSFGGQRFAQPQRRRQAPPTGNQQQQSSLISLLPVLILCAFALLSQLPSLFTTPDPTYSFEPTSQHGLSRTTWNWNVPYYVNENEWGQSEVWKSVPEARKGEQKAAMYSSKVRGFERGVESVYAGRLRNECERFMDLRERRVSQESGFFGIGADFEKIRKIRSEQSPACEQLRRWGIGTQQPRQQGLF